MRRHPDQEFTGRRLTTRELTGRRRAGLVEGPPAKAGFFVGAKMPRPALRGTLRGLGSYDCLPGLAWALSQVALYGGTEALY